MTNRITTMKPLRLTFTRHDRQRKQSKSDICKQSPSRHRGLLQTRIIARESKYALSSIRRKRRIVHEGVRVYNVNRASPCLSIISIVRLRNRRYGALLGLLVVRDCSRALIDRESDVESLIISCRGHLDASMLQFAVPARYRTRLTGTEPVSRR